MSYVTRQKQVLGAVFERAKRPLTAEEIRQEARKDIPTLGIATVYRAIKEFVAAGRVRPVEVPGAGPHYERAGRSHHHFFLCQQCKRLFDLIGCVHGVQSLAPSGFRVQEHEIVLYGECVSCATEAGEGRR